MFDVHFCLEPNSAPPGDGAPGNGPAAELTSSGSPGSKALGSFMDSVLQVLRSVAPERKDSPRGSEPAGDSAAQAEASRTQPPDEAAAPAPAAEGDGGGSVGAEAEVAAATAAGEAAGEAAGVAIGEAAADTAPEVKQMPLPPLSEVNEDADDAAAVETEVPNEPREPGGEALAFDGLEPPEEQLEELTTAPAPAAASSPLLQPRALPPFGGAKSVPQAPSAARQPEPAASQAEPLVSDKQAGYLRSLGLTVVEKEMTMRQAYAAIQLRITMQAVYHQEQR
ncbi:hypothetical protein HXX76_011013 [Chlamydomonas incerta]|uniref:Uncharacterized protein n=1 Tax=Chlamydomonas incerta TaxID=51695 RepID=A0A835SVY8_CHLIN|nr:hypothetical protein HXX76_011013 [Chlamydomonas incerta]|eukprot:KAG2429244.1 hypothetical protein HXX76_011013 [Chlamydomonas incerta]